MFPSRTLRRSNPKGSGTTNLADESKPVDVVVLGAGFAGAAVALELASSGLTVALVDRDARPLNRAHRRHVGKIELGFNSQSAETFEEIENTVDAALVFGDAMRQWLGQAPVTSLPFQYWIPASDESQVQQFADRCQRVADACAARFANTEADEYLGIRPGQLWRETAPRDSNPHHTMRVFETEERAVDTDVLALQLADRINDDPAIRFEGNVEIRDIEATPAGYRVLGERFGNRWSIDCATLVNATQHNRAQLHRTLGVDPTEEWSQRLQVRLIVRLPEVFSHLQSVSMPIAPYGDLVVRRDGTAYLSWHPEEGRFSTDEIDALTRAKSDSDLCKQIAARVLGDYAFHLKGIEASAVLQVDCTHRLVPSDSTSGISRNGFLEQGNFYAVQPGTLTTGPFHGIQLARHIIQKRGASLGKTGDRVSPGTLETASKAQSPANQ